jgi:hypothetical protein
LANALDSPSKAASKFRTVISFSAAMDGMNTSPDLHSKAYVLTHGAGL